MTTKLVICETIPFFDLRRFQAGLVTETSFYRPHPKDGEGNVFSLSTPGGGGGQSSRGGQVSPAGGGVRSVQPGRG